MKYLKIRDGGKKKNKIGEISQFLINLTRYLFIFCFMLEITCTIAEGLK